MNRLQEEEISRLHAEICAGLSDPTRLLILYELADGPRTVSQLTQCLRLSQPMISRHLRILRERGMALASRMGATVEYRLSDPRLIESMDLERAVLRDHLSRRAELVSALARS